MSEGRVLNHLFKLNVNNVSGPDEIPNWFLKEYADIIAKILNASLKEQYVPSIWYLLSYCSYYLLIFLSEIIFLYFSNTEI